MTDSPAPAGRLDVGAPKRAPHVTYSSAIAEAICDLAAQGHNLSAICRRRGMPARTAVEGWMKKRADFAQAFALAVQAGGGPHRAGRRSAYSLELAAEFCRRLGEGRAMYRVCQDEDMPSGTAIYLWLNKHPEFVAMYANAREIQAERLCDEVQEIADGASSETLAVDKTRIGVRQWRATNMAPRKYGTRINQEHPDAVVINVEVVEF
ncbi:hypothetical protein BH10PSE5_BH10PSE5_12850 [soil metagenome]